MVCNFKARSFLTLVSLVGVRVHMSPVLMARSPPCYCRARTTLQRRNSCLHLPAAATRSHRTRSRGSAETAVVVVVVVADAVVKPVVGAATDVVVVVEDVVVVVFFVEH